ncbi:MAG TPA: response regulator [Acidobacteriaceae bacterium]|jgi:DNA-binding response OmpR family regulator|nr:response regulator [Acidobacteriaceae bacterium]
MKRRILLVDDEVAILLALKAILEINDFEVETAASAREAKAKLRTSTFHMVISDMRMEDEASGLEVLRAAKKAPYQPAFALLTAFPESDDGWRNEGADQMLVKPMNTNELLRQLESLLVSNEDKKQHAAKTAVPVLAASAASPRKGQGRANGRKATTAQAR